MIGIGDKLSNELGGYVYVLCVCSVVEGAAGIGGSVS